MNRYRRILAAALVVGALASTTAACNVGADTAENVRDAVNLLPAARLGAIPVRIDEDGRIAEVAGFDTNVVDAIAESVSGGPVIGRIKVLSPLYLDWFRKSNIQHITVASRPEGLFVFVNGEALPYIRWDDDSMGNLVDALEMFERDGHGAYLLPADTQKNVSAILPVLPKLGLQLRFELPVPDGVERIPAPDEADFEDAVLSTMAEPAGAPLNTIALDVDYKPLTTEEGEVVGWVPSAFGLSTVDLRQVLSSVNMTVPRYRLRRDIEARMQREEIETIGIQARHDGVYLSVDGRLLPSIAWSDETLVNLSRLLAQLYPEGTRLPRGASWVPVVRATAPMLNDFDLALQVTFPVGSNAAE
jgi:hypothetical protein